MHLWTCKEGWGLKDKMFLYNAMPGLSHHDCVLRLFNSKEESVFNLQRHGLLAPNRASHWTKHVIQTCNWSQTTIMTLNIELQIRIISGSCHCCKPQGPGENCRTLWPIRLPIKCSRNCKTNHGPRAWHLISCLVNVCDFQLLDWWFAGGEARSYFAAQGSTWKRLKLEHSEPGNFNHNRFHYLLTR